MKPFHSREKFVILMHPKEYRKGINTGRLAKRLMTNCELFIGPDFSENQRITEIIEAHRDNCYILFPGPQASNLSSMSRSKTSNESAVFFILDATWSMAKKMLKTNPFLQELNQVQFQPKFQSRYAIRKQPEAHCLSTIETVFTILEQFNDAEESEHLQCLDLLDRMVQRQINYEQKT